MKNFSIIFILKQNRQRVVFFVLILYTLKVRKLINDIFGVIANSFKIIENLNKCKVYI